MHTSFASFQSSYFCLLLGQNFVAFCHGIGPREMSFGKSMFPSSFSVNVLSPTLRQTEDIVLSLTTTLNSLNASVVYSVFSSIFLLSLCSSVRVAVCLQCSLCFSQSPVSLPPVHHCLWFQFVPGIRDKSSMAIPICSPGVLYSFVYIYQNCPQRGILLFCDLM